MIRPNKNPLIPHSWPADGNQGASADTKGVGGAENTRPEAEPLWLALTATCGAIAHLDCYAGLTDDPVPGVVDAADLLEAARVELSGSLS